MDKPTLQQAEAPLSNQDHSTNANGHSHFIEDRPSRSTANSPFPLTQGDIAELADIEVIRESWGAETVTEMIELFEDSIYGVKFDFVSGCPGYVGPLYILHGDSLERPFRLIGREGRLVILDDCDE